jgi:hypothetical protein
MIIDKKKNNEEYSDMQHMQKQTFSSAGDAESGQVWFVYPVRRPGLYECD